MEKSIKVKYEYEYTIDILKTEFPRELSKEEEIEFYDWLKYKAKEVGRDKQCEYYTALEDCGDVKIIFFVK